MKFTPAIQFASILALISHAAAVCQQKPNVKLTFFGYPDNSPPGPATTHNCRGTSGDGVAGGKTNTHFYRSPASKHSPPLSTMVLNPRIGIGTYANPLTMAIGPGLWNLQPCDIIYVPFLKKYLRYDDTCGACSMFLSLSLSSIFSTVTNSPHTSFLLSIPTINETNPPRVSPPHQKSTCSLVSLTSISGSGPAASTAARTRSVVS